MNVYNFENRLFSIRISLQTFTAGTHVGIKRNKHFRTSKNDNIFHIIKGLENNVLNRTLPSLHGGSFKITLTVPLKFFTNQTLLIVKDRKCSLLSLFLFFIRFLRYETKQKSLIKVFLVLL